MLRVGSRLIVAAISVASLQAAVLPSDALAARTITLDEAIARALQVAPSMESAAAQSDLDSARFKKALAPFFPWVAGNGEHYQPCGYDKPISNDGLTQAQLALTYTEAPNLSNFMKGDIGGAGVPVTVPENAIVAQRTVSSGQMMADLYQLADLIDPPSIFVAAAVPVDDIATIRPGWKRS